MMDNPSKFQAGRGTIIRYGDDPKYETRPCVVCNNMYNVQNK